MDGSGAGGMGRASGWPVGLLCQLPPPQLRVCTLFLLSQRALVSLCPCLGLSFSLCSESGPVCLSGTIICLSGTISLAGPLSPEALSDRVYPHLFDHIPDWVSDLHPPQEFLKKEFSAENLTFWKACERFQQIPASDTQQVRVAGSCGGGRAGTRAWAVPLTVSCPACPSWLGRPATSTRSSCPARR